MANSYSVVIPAFNGVDFIDAALDSVQQQTLQPIETIVVDDGSTDGTVDRVQQHTVDCKLVQTTRANGAGARNAGVEVASGDWIAFLDCDDVWYADHLERTESLIDGSDAIAALNQFDHMDAESGEIRQRKPFFPTDKAQNDLTATDYFRWLGSNPIFVGMSAFSMKRTVFNQLGGLDTTQVRRHDIEFWLRVIDGRQWAYDPVASSVYRVGHAGNLSGNAANAAYYLLKAFAKHESTHPPAEIHPMLSQAAHSALVRALTDGAPGDFELAWPVASKHLSLVQRVCYRAAKLARPVFATANRMRRSLR